MDNCQQSTPNPSAHAKANQHTVRYAPSGVQRFRLPVCLRLCPNFREFSNLWVTFGCFGYPVFWGRYTTRPQSIFVSRYWCICPLIQRHISFYHPCALRVKVYNGTESKLFTQIDSTIILTEQDYTGRLPQRFYEELTHD